MKRQSREVKEKRRKKSQEARKKKKTEIELLKDEIYY
mgnify:CR=1 FL=1